MRFRALSGLLAVSLLACAATPPAINSPASPTKNATASAGQSELDRYTIPPPPDWMDRYANTDLGTDVRFFRIARLMTDFGLSRFAAVEVQNHYRHLTARGVAHEAAWQQALIEARAGHFRSGVDADKLRSAPFIVVYDLDETLYQAFYKSGARGPAYRDISFQSRGHEVFIKLRPGWQRAIARIHELGGLVMLFTARSDDVAEGAAEGWFVDGQPIRKVVDGFCSKSCMVMQEKSDGDPILTASKDLRIFDEKLERVIIVDDNPRRVVQHSRQRLIKKFQADPYLEIKNGAAGSSPLTLSFEATLPLVVREIEESVDYMKTHAGTPFARAYLPYTMLGQVAAEALRGAQLSEGAARAYIRENPSYVDEAF